MSWRDLVEQQAGVASRAQLELAGINRDHIAHRVQSERWQLAGPLVVVTNTGAITWEQRLWIGVLHAGRPAALTGLTALKQCGLTGWDRPDVSIAIPKSEDAPVLNGYRFVETRRDLVRMTAHGAPPRLQVEPAALLFSAYTPSERTACGLLAAVVQQRLTTAVSLLEYMKTMRPLRRAPLFREVLADIAGGVHSMAEHDVVRMCHRHGLAQPQRQVMRRDRYGKRRFTDAEWTLPGGRTLVLEIDGAFHMEVEHWWQDIARDREHVVEGRLVVRCTSIELRRADARIASDLRSLGVPGARPNARGA